MHASVETFEYALSGMDVSWESLGLDVGSSKTISRLLTFPYAKNDSQQ
jgi:hypothetical protein